MAAHGYAAQDHARSEPTTVRIAATDDQTWALDADFLYERLDRLKPVGKHYVHRIRLLDLMSDLLLVAGVLSAFFVAWWTIIPLVGFACIQRVSNRRMAGELAGEAAKESTEAFLYLYNSGALWLDNAPTRPALNRARRLRSRSLF
ncbi:MAG: hypothetical protein QNI84_01135 [Henriciella sp.]|nr:hypothetical protein [Henriciella sp.]